jgi:hypothetical protein
MFDTFSWPSVKDGFQEFGNSKVKVPATHFRYILIGDGKYEKILNNIIGEWCEFKAIGQKFLFLDLLDRVICRSDRFPPLVKFISKGLHGKNMMKNKCRSSL